MALSDLSIRERITLQYVRFVGLLLICFSVSIFFFGKLYIKSRFYRRLQDRGIFASYLYFDFNSGQKAMFDLYETKDIEKLNNEVISIYDVKRKLFVVSSDINKEALHKTFLEGYEENNFSYETSEDNLQFVAISVRDQKLDPYLVCISADDVVGKRNLTDIQKVLSILSLAALIMVAIQGWYFAGKALMPLNSVISQLKVVFPRNLNKRIQHDNPNDEIGELTGTLNGMLQRAEEATSTQKLLVANISHELKNPLTKIFTQIEILELKYKNQPEFLENILSLKRDTQRLIHLNEVILGLANRYTLESTIPMERVRLDELMLEVWSEFKKWKPASEVKLELDLITENENELQVIGNRDALMVVFKNLIDNACKFSKDNSCIFGMEFDQTGIQIQVTNIGNEIPEDQIDKIFQPFYRSDSTAKGKEGHGIGLAVVKQILELHKADISIVSKNDMTTFKVNFYTKNDNQSSQT
ncbi:MAG: HAMP domain-containing sensor histidine kinase [Leadbetterella sp.]